MKSIKISDETGYCGCLFMMVIPWLISIAAVGGYKLFLWIIQL